MPDAPTDRQTEFPRGGRALRWVSVALVVVTYILVTSGGLVTSYNAGMSVPDWPSSFGRWLLIPVYLWADLAIFLEHNHRLTGALAGLVAIGVLVAAGRAYGLKHKLSLLAAITVLLFIVQGLMGGFRVTEISTTLAIVHGVHGQVVFGLVVALAALTGVWAMRQNQQRAEDKPRTMPVIVKATAAVFALLIVVQLTLGAVVRHTHTASAIPDAPAVYGGFVPPMDDAERAQEFTALGGETWTLYAEEPAAPMEAVEQQENPELLSTTERVAASAPTDAAVLTHYAHRVGGMVVLPAVMFGLLMLIAKHHPTLLGMKAPMGWLLGLFAVQVLLGLSVIWSKEHPVIATGHQAVGAALLGVTVWLNIRVFGQQVVAELGCVPTVWPEVGCGKLEPEAEATLQPEAAPEPEGVLV